ncbi:hypothetical protein [Aliiruegeria lutimaris]|uniref:Uncharacterized protein n=1 Tax=Aliiruegeria lutimaris TaxID=571298 RepID=A0A1G8TRT6_9RHOB|nr:hypothetical protein [Aliiruegeria lutimaris]SDJ43420.1 hypothetical protein SAMN04488026_101761 [Aliiruegeria lutimaris]
MRTLFCSPFFQLILLLRHVWLRMLTGLVVGHAPKQVRSRICALPLLDQALLVGASMLGLALASMLFAEAGPGGPAAMWIALYLVCR